MMHLIDPRRSSVRRRMPTPFRSDWNALFDTDSFDRLFAEPWLAPRSAAPDSFAPKVNVSETEEAYRFSVELPGLAPDDFEVLVDADVLVIKGEKHTESSEEDSFHRVECSSGAFERKFRLGWEIDADRLEAAYKNGVLEIRVPKPAEEQSAVRTIPVTAS